MRIRDTFSKRKKICLTLVAFFSFLVLFSLRSLANSESSFTILDSEQKGTFNIGIALGSTAEKFDSILNKDVLRFKYWLPKGSIVGVWTKSYPQELNKESVDAVKISLKALDKKQLKEVAVKMEIKGSSAMQSIPLELKNNWSFLREEIAWNTIGELDEVCFVVMTLYDSESANSELKEEALEGYLYFDAEFYKQSFLYKNYIFFRIALVLLLSFIIAIFFPVAAKLKQKSSQYRKEGATTKKGSIVSSIKKDLLYGVTITLVIAVAFGLALAGSIYPLNNGFSFEFIFIGLAGLIIAELLKFTITGRHLNSQEAFKNVLILSLLAASSSRLGILFAPSNFGQILMLNRYIAVIAFLIYQTSSARSLAIKNEHLGDFTAFSIVLTPYLFNWLMVLQTPMLLQQLGRFLTLGLLSGFVEFLEFLGRVVVVYGFNEAIANGFSLVIKKEPIKRKKLHFFMLAISIAVVTAPVIADLGSTAKVGSLPDLLKISVVILTSMLSFAGLWGLVYFLTGMALDYGRKIAPTWESVTGHVKVGVKKGMAYSALLMGFIYSIYLLVDFKILQLMADKVPLFLGLVIGGLTLPLFKTIIETFDGSLPFFQRARYNYRDHVLYARGIIVGLGAGYAFSNGFIGWDMSKRVLFGAALAVLASAGVSILRDIFYKSRSQGRIQSWRRYFIDALLGAFVGSALAFYLDVLQVPVVIEKFKLYTSSGFKAIEYITYPLVNRWGRIDLGSYSGGVRLLFDESLAGVINWAIAAWLFAINKVFLLALFEKHKAPIKFFFSREGLAQLIEHMIYVLRWGLWMSPIIFTFLRMMPDPTWYNQDGAIRTLVAIYQNMTMSDQAFRLWSLNVFVYILAFDIFRVFIWMDHMGLRVATLVNLSFIGLDRLDEKVAKFIKMDTAQRYIPEAVKRFCTWGPLLIPFYIPRGDEWNYAWNSSVAIRESMEGGFSALLERATSISIVLVLLFLVIVLSVISFLVRAFRKRSRKSFIKTYSLENKSGYRTCLKENGEAYSQVDHKKSGVYPPEYDITRRSYDIIDPCGRVLYLVDESADKDRRYWPVVGNFPEERFKPSKIIREKGSLKIINSFNGVKTKINIVLPDQDSRAEIWKIEIENLEDKKRNLKVIPYLEWVLNGGLHDRFHTQYARLFPEMEYIKSSNTLLSWHKCTGSMGILAADISPEGMLFSRMDFIGRAQSIWKPRILDTLDFMKAENSERYPTFDPIGSLMLSVALEPKASKSINIMIGYEESRKGAVELVKKLLNPKQTGVDYQPKREKKFLIGHGEILPGTPQPYSEYSDDGNKIIVKTPYTPRPYDHAMSNSLGHSLMVTNRGLHTSCNGNSQQNRLTPDWPDTVTREIPGEAIYIYDIDEKGWYSPTYFPLNDNSVKNRSEFSVDGTAVFQMEGKDISTELTVFVPPDQPLGLYLLNIKNNSPRKKRLRIAPYFQMVLEFMPERSGELITKYDKDSETLLFYNPRNMFRKGWAFVSSSEPLSEIETKRGRFFGLGRGISCPFMLERGKADERQLYDDRQIAVLMSALEIPAGKEHTVAFVLGQTEKRDEAIKLAKRYTEIENVKKSLEDTRNWWLSFVSTVELKTDQIEFDRYQNWLKYQALAERIWARRGFYQTSGAYGFRDQLQDSVNLIWADPKLARKQIALHASHQFFEGDVYHWFFTKLDNRTAFACRSHASDNPLWLPWAIVEYIRMTGDYSLLDETASYVWSEFPFADLPHNKSGWGHIYHRSTRAESVYRHALRSIDLILKKRMGEHGIPLIRTGDWNDGLDEIGSEGKGESVWLGFFLYYILKNILPIIEKKEGVERKDYYLREMRKLEEALEATWREDRYLRAIHDDGTEIGIKDSGVWEIDALTAAWAVKAGVNLERSLIVFHTALEVLERENVVLLGWPALREDTKPYLGRSSRYPEGVRENGMYCHGVQWLIKASRVLAERFERLGDYKKADQYRAISYRLWRKITPIDHVAGEKIEVYGGQPNKQPADILTNFEVGRMIWNGYTGAAGWLFRQSMEGVVGASLINNKLVLPDDISKPRGQLKVEKVFRDISKSPLK
jgi:cyclic beta-1,2-glucan synthetase